MGHDPRLHDPAERIEVFQHLVIVLEGRYGNEKGEEFGAIARLDYHALSPTMLYPQHALSPTDALSPTGALSPTDALSPHALSPHLTSTPGHIGNPKTMLHPQLC